MKIVLITCLLYVATSSAANLKDMRDEALFKRDVVEGEGTDLFEGDILLTPEQKAAIEAAIAEQGHTLYKRKAIADVVKVWPKKTLPYIIDGNAPNHDRIRAAIDHWNTKTCIKVVPHTAELAAELGHNNKVKFVRHDTDCSSWVGRITQWNEQKINLANWCSVGNIVHEIGHALGFWHEHTRRDRDYFVTVNMGNVEWDARHNFEKYDLGDGDDYGVSYDLSSIMQYPSTAFSIGGATITVNNGPDSFIGQRQGLSYYDIKLIRLLYGCKERECYVRGDASDYRGTVSTTTTGKSCQKWSDQAPHQHGHTPDNYPETGLGEHNYCRNPRGERENAWCYTTDANTPWELCDIGQEGENCNIECFLRDDERDYRGTVSKTTSGKTCQKWTSQSPHGHSYTPANHPNAGIGDHNYCRAEDWHAAWCYTTDPNSRWEECDVGEKGENCDAECFLRSDADDYRGRVSTTKSGRTCQKWTKQSPHGHTYTPANYPDAGLGDHNYCRGVDWAATWCYTTDPSKRWEECDPGEPVRSCGDECFVQEQADDYRGTVSYTENGKTCQKWTSQSPHGHSYTPGNYPNDGLGDHNYCRGVDWNRAWCYTTDPNTRWQNCNIGSPTVRCD